MKNTNELSDLQLDAISGGCHRPEPKHCKPNYNSCDDDDYSYNKCEPKHYKCDDDYKPRYDHCKRHYS